jgi:DNA polymerase-3 subunit delta'
MPCLKLPTIVSRCEVIRLRPLSIEETSAGLQTVRGVPSDEADHLAHLSGGRPGYALQLYAQPKLLEQRQTWLDELLGLLASSRRERFAFAKESVENPGELRSQLQIWLTFWRDVLITAAGITSSLTNVDYSSKIEQLAEEVGLQNAQFYVNNIENTMERIDRNVNPRLALEVLLMDYPRINFSG